MEKFGILMIDILTCIFIGITALLLLGKWMYPILLKYRKRCIKRCSFCEKRIYWWQSSESVNTAHGYYYVHLKCQRRS